MKKQLIMFLCVALIFLPVLTCSAEETSSKRYDLSGIEYSVPFSWKYEGDEGVNAHYAHTLGSVNGGAILTFVEEDDLSGYDIKGFYEDLAKELSSGQEYSCEATIVEGYNAVIVHTGKIYDIGETNSATLVLYKDGFLYIMSFCADSLDQFPKYSEVFESISFHSNEHEKLKQVDVSILTDSEVALLNAEIEIAKIVRAAGHLTPKQSNIIDLDYSELLESELLDFEARIDLEMNVRSNNAIALSVSKIISFFFELCATDGIYFDNTQSTSQMEGSNNIDKLVKYSVLTDGNTYDVWYRTYVNGGFQAHIGSSCKHGNTDRLIYRNFISAITSTEKDEAAILMDETFMRSYLAGETVEGSYGDYVFTAFFSDDNRFLMINSK